MTARLRRRQRGRSVSSGRSPGGLFTLIETWVIGAPTQKAVRFLKELGYHTQFHGNGPPSMYHTTGFTKDEIRELCVMVRDVRAADRLITWPPVLGLWNSIAVTLAYLRRNRVQ